MDKFEIHAEYTQCSGAQVVWVSKAMLLTVKPDYISLVASF